MIDLILTLVFCFAIVRLGYADNIDGRFVLIGIVIWFIGWLEGKREQKNK